MVNFQLNKITLPLQRLLQVMPALPVALAAAIGYFFHLVHWPLFWRLPLVLPVFGLNLLAGHFFGIWLRRRIDAGSGLGLELGIAFVGTGGLLLLPEVLFGAGLTSGIVIVFLGWLVLQFLLKQAGHFYTGFLGLSIFLLVIYSFHILHFEERATLHMISRSRASAIRTALRESYDWRKGEERMSLQKRTSSGLRPWLTLPLPPDLYFHDPVDLQLDYRHALAGIPIGVLSANARKPTIPPVMILFDLADDGQALFADRGDPAAVKPVLERLLGHMQNTGLLSDLRYLGPRVSDFRGLEEAEKEPDSERDAGADRAPVYRGIFWAYTETESTRTIQTGVYLFGTKERPFLFLIREPIFREFKHHPDVLEVLRDLRLPDQAPAR